MQIISEWFSASIKSGFFFGWGFLLLLLLFTTFSREKMKAFRRKTGKGKWPCWFCARYFVLFPHFRAAIVRNSAVVCFYSIRYWIIGKTCTTPQPVVVVCQTAGLSDSQFFIFSLVSWLSLRRANIVSIRRPSFVFPLQWPFSRRRIVAFSPEDTHTHTHTH